MPSTNTRYQVKGGTALLNPSIKKVEDIILLFEQLMRTDLARKNLDKPFSEAYERVKQELADAEAQLNKIQADETKEKSTLNAAIIKKKKWISDVDDAKREHFLTLWTTMFHGYRIDLVINQEHVRVESFGVIASKEFVTQLQTVIAKGMQIEGIACYASILSRFSQSIKTLVIEDKTKITLDRIQKVFAGDDLTIEHNCVGHAVYTQLYTEGNQLFIKHCNRGYGQRAKYNLVYQTNSARVDVDKLRLAIETITGLEVPIHNEEHYKLFYDHYDETLKNLGFSFSWGKYVKSQKIGNCVLANLKGLLKERLPDDVYKWCTKEIRNQSHIQHLITPMLKTGKALKNKVYALDTDDHFFQLRQLINYILDKSVEGVLNGYFGNDRKFQAIKKAFEAIEDYEKVLNSNKALNNARRANIKNYIHSKIGLYKQVFNYAEIQKPELFYQIVFDEAEKISVLSSDDPIKKEFFNYLISKAVSNPNFFSGIYDYFSRIRKENSRPLLRIILNQAIEIIDSMPNDPEHMVFYQSALRRILLNECEQAPYDQEIITLLIETSMINKDTNLYISAYHAMKEHKNDDFKYTTLQLLLVSTIKHNEFLDLFVRKVKAPPHVPSFFIPKKQAQGQPNLFSFFKMAAQIIIDTTEAPLTQKKLQLHIEKMVYDTVERKRDKYKVKRFLELFCYKQLIDSQRINEQNINFWIDMHILAHQCIQINYCFPESREVAESIITSHHEFRLFALNLECDQNLNADDQIIWF